MLTLLLLVPAQSAASIPALNRFEQFMAKADPLVAAYTVKVNGQRYGDITLQIDRPSRLRAVFKSSEGTLAYVINESGAMEINHVAKIYAQHPPIGRLFLPPLKVTEPLNYAISQGLVVGKREAIAQPNGKPTVKSNVMVGGVPTDEVSTRTAGVAGETLMKSYIDRQGRLMKYWLKTATRNGSLEIEYLMSSYSVGKPISASVFSTTLPLGYSPYGLARADFGLPQGGPVPDIQLRKVSGGSPVSLKSLFRGKNALVLLTDPEYPANAEMLRSTREAMKKIPNAELIVIGMRRDPASAKAVGGDDAYYDPSGLQLQKLAVPGAPTFYLFRSNGTLAQMFFGFDGKWEELQQGLDLLKK